MIYKWNKQFLILLIGLLSISLTLKSQQVQLTGPEFNDLKKLIGNYISYYNVANSTDPLPEAQFNNLFADNRIIIPRDFPAAAWEDSTLPLSTYHLNFNAFLKDSTVESVEIFGTRDVLYCKTKDCWYAWVQKAMEFAPETGRTAYITVARLKIIRLNNNTLKIKEIKLVRQLPDDKDKDFIVDENEEGILCDNCISKVSLHRTNFIALNGCNNDDLDGDGITNDKDSCIYEKGVRSNHGCPNPPSSRFGFTIAGGVLVPLFNEFSNQDRVSGASWERNGYYAKLGFMIDAAFNMNMTRYAGIALGAIYNNKPLDASHLANQISYYLGNTSTIATSVTVSSMSYQLLIPYVGLQLGNLKSAGNNIIIEPIIGLAITDLGFFKNNFKVNIQYQDSTGTDGVNFPSTSNLSFKTPPFLVYGIKFNYTHKLDNDNKARLVATASYLAGDYNFTSQTVYLKNTTSQLTFTGSRFQFLGLSLGLYFNLGTPKKYKKWY